MRLVRIERDGAGWWNSLSLRLRLSFELRQPLAGCRALRTGLLPSLSLGGRNWLPNRWARRPTRHHLLWLAHLRLWLAYLRLSLWELVLRHLNARILILRRNICLRRNSPTRTCDSTRRLPINWPLNRSLHALYGWLCLHSCRRRI